MEKLKGISPSRSDSVESLRATTRKLLSAAVPSRSRSNSAPVQPAGTKAMSTSSLATTSTAPARTPASQGPEKLSRKGSSSAADRSPMAAGPECSLASRSPDLAAAMAQGSGGGQGQAECQVFDGLTYCGHCTVDAPISQTEANRSMNTLRKQPQESMRVSVSVPVTCEGAVRFIDQESGLELTNYPIRSVLFCARGTRDNNARDCMAFTVAHRQGGVFYCHVLKADDEDKIRHILRILGVAFKDNTQKQRIMQATEGRLKTLDYQFEVMLDLGEDDGKGNYLSVARDKDLFKMRQNIPKQVVLMIVQRQGPLVILRCFGLLIGLGNSVEEASMNPTDMVNMCQHEDGKSYLVNGVWDPSDSNHSQLNQETPKGEKICMTIAADLVFAGIADPVRFVRTVRARVYRKNERFWISTRQPSMEIFHMRLREVQSTTGASTPVSGSSTIAPAEESEPALPAPSASKQPASDGKATSAAAASTSACGGYEVEVLEILADRPATASTSSTNSLEVTASLPVILSSPVSSSLSRHDSLPSPSGLIDRRQKSLDVGDNSANENSDSDDPDGLTIEDDEPLASGSGHVDKQLSSRELESWSNLLAHWDGSGRPKQLTTLVRKRGVPEPLRGRVWEMLAGLTADLDLLDNFRVLVTKESPQERVIQEDISRTYPAHDYFRSDGEGQQALYKISKAYSIYDKEVGYCQGLSFLIAALVLHMPMEQAFGVLVRVMYDYEVRDLFRDEFKALKLKLFQLQKLIEDTMPDLAQHFANESVETHMFASQWFLTLYSSKFPLHAVYRILDLVLTEGSAVIFQVGLALLKIAKQDLLALDFENILKYFRVQLPKKFSTEEQAAALLRQVVSIKVADRKLKKYQRDHTAFLEAEALSCDPVERLKRLNTEQSTTIVRLEQENDVLATELVTSKVHLRTEMDELERKVDRLSKQIRSKDDELHRAHQDKQQITEEFVQFKELYQQSLLELNDFRGRYDKEREEQRGVAREMDERHVRIQHDLQQELMEVKARFSKLHERYRSLKTAGTPTPSPTLGGSGRVAESPASIDNAAADSSSSTAAATAASSSTLRPDAPPSAGNQAAERAAAQTPLSVDELHFRDEEDDGLNGISGTGADSIDEESLSAEQRCRELEVQMAHYKLQLVEAECKIQDLQHALRTSAPDNSEQESSKVNRWLSKLR